MKLPCSWLKELSGVSWTPEEMSVKLTASGSAGDPHYLNPDHFANIVVAEIIAAEKHPDADKLTVTQVSDGKTTHQIVCGAPNCAAGQRVALALPGASLQGEFKIKATKIRGVASSGMICAEDELGLGDDHSGIMILPENAPVGAALYDYLELGDPVFDFEITPNRPDCLSAHGIARELAVLDGRTYDMPAVAVTESTARASDFISVRIEDPRACPRYAARIIENIKIGPSPQWIQKRLLDCGIRPVNNVVDITNYVMLETNQPLHAFDYDRFGSKEVVVRRANDGEKFTTLDGNEHTLSRNVLMITNGARGVAAGGVMGGLESEVEEDTTTVLLEAAYFDPSVIRKSRNELGLSSESSYRFERGVDPNAVIYASNRAALLMAELAGGKVAAGMVDAYPSIISGNRISLRHQRVTQLLGIDVPREFIFNTLKNLGMDVTDGDPIEVITPTWRPDLEREVDLIEEIARIFGLDNIPVTRTNSGPLYTPTHDHDVIKDRIRDILTGFGLDESIGSGMAHPARMVEIDSDLEPIKITNSISDDFGVMRTRLLYSLIVSAGNNTRHRNVDFKLFEVGKVYLRAKTGYIEPAVCGLVLSGKSSETFWQQPPSDSDFYEIKGIVCGLLSGLKVTDVTVTPAAVAGYAGGQAYAIYSGDIHVGTLGVVDPKIARKFDIKQICFAAEIEIEAVLKARYDRRQFKPLPKFPASSRDIAAIVDTSVPAGEMIEAIEKIGGEIVESVAVFDLFMGGQIPEGNKSLAFSVIYRSGEKTLEDSEVDAVHVRIVEYLEKTFGAKLRE